MTQNVSAILIAATFSLLMNSNPTLASTPIRATGLNQKVWSDFEAGKMSEILVEFRQGDRLPVTVLSQGDFLETTESNPSYVNVKRPFWVKFTKKEITMSLDGSHFSPIQDTVKGTLMIGANDQLPSNVASAINMVLKAEIK